MRDRDQLNRWYEHTLYIRPFVGVNAPMTAPVTQGVGQRYDAHFKGSDVERFLGLHVSWKDLHGIVRDGKWANHYPSLDAIPKLVETRELTGTARRVVNEYGTAVGGLL